MAPVTQYVFAEMLGISEHFTAGSHEWLPYSVIPTFPKLICRHQFVAAGNFAIDISHRLEYAVGSTARAAGKKGDFIMTVREIVDS